MARTAKQVIDDIMCGNSIQILDGKRFGTLLGELLKMLRVSDAQVTEMYGLKQLCKELAREVLVIGMENQRLRVALEAKTSEGLKATVLNNNKLH